ncbi:IclR family transcriptional regulator [Fundicoccus sp. Sow4_D5]|uniref:IclR family transcriptional regulator n=1 Tax=unclassified Fundicoccus TaxID=2761543 RepID=UPI003F8F6674
MSEKRSGQLSSVKNALKILKSFTTTQPVKRVSDLAEELGVSKSTVSRLISTLVSEDFLAPDTETAGYRLGYSVLTLGGALTSTNELYREVAPVLNNIVLQTGESAHVAVLEGQDVIYLNKNTGPYYSNILTSVGAHNAAYAASSGKVILAEADPEVIDQMFEDGVKAYTEHTITNPIKFKKELEKVRRQGYAMSIEEITKNNYSIAVPVRDMSGKIACAITVVGPLSRVNKGKLEQFIKIMKEAAHDASERLGYDEDDNH